MNSASTRPDVILQPERLVQRTTYDHLIAVTHLMRDFPAPWFVSGGWAIDTFLGCATREHEDLEIGIVRADQGLLHRYLPDWQLYKIVDGGTPDAALGPWSEGEQLELPVFQIVVQQHGSVPPEFEFFLNDVIDGELRFRPRPSIRRPFVESYLRTEGGIPVIAPDLQLLYKSRRHSPKDEHDFGVVLDRLSQDRRSWLAQVLETYRPHDPWLATLRSRA